MSHAHWRSFQAAYRVNVPIGSTEASLRRATDDGNFLMECVLAQCLADRGDYDAAFKHFTHASERGSAMAVYNAALLTGAGLGTAKSPPDAEKLLRRAALGGITAAKHWLGYNLALTGDDGGGDVAEGVRLIRAAAKTGLVEAMFDFGMMHLYNTALAEGSANTVTGVRWLQHAFQVCECDASRSELAAEIAFHLSTFHYTTRAARRDKKTVAAYQYAEFAASAGHALAQDFLGQILVKGARNGAPTAAASNMEEAAKWFAAAAAQGVISSKRDLALLIETGSVLPGDEGLARATKLYEDAAAAGDIMSTFRLGVCYGTGKIVERDATRSRELLLTAAHANCIPAIAHILSTKMLADGEDDTEVDALKMRLVAIASDKKHAERIHAIRALSSIGAIPSCHGCGVTKYEIKGVELSKCSTCLAARYCTRACQQADWKNHRDECDAIVRAKETLASEDAPVEAVEGQ